MPIRLIPAFRYLLSLTLWLGMAFPIAADTDSHLALPELGDQASGVISKQQEHDMGQSWLRLFRSRVPESTDDVMYDYLDRLLKKLVASSAVEDKQLSLILVSNPTLNAFAVPGGVIGVNNGIFLFAENEQELAGVLSHELAHLSQRHFVRSYEKSRQNSIPTMAGLLAGLVLMTTTGSDAGIATVMATQAANMESQLRFSRENEAEADRVGMQTLVNAEMDPRAMPAMFERMSRSARFMGERPPEFLLSHPVTEKRIADTRNRAEQYPLKHYTDSLDYQLMASRARLFLAENPAIAARYFQNELQGESDNQDQSLHRDACRYGLALAQLAQHQFDQAKASLQPLLAKDPKQTAYQIAKAEIFLGEKNLPDAYDSIQKTLQQSPDNYPATMLAVRILQAQGRFDIAIKYLMRLLDTQHENPKVWFQLAEVRGLAGDIGGVHQARAEYFILNGVFDQARQQLIYALQQYAKNSVQTSRIKQRLHELSEIEAQSLEL
jgi:predicted Zn-dependent protease